MYTNAYTYKSDSFSIYYSVWFSEIRHRYRLIKVVLCSYWRVLQVLRILKISIKGKNVNRSLPRVSSGSERRQWNREPVHRMHTIIVKWNVTYASPIFEHLRHARRLRYVHSHFCWRFGKIVSLIVVRHHVLTFRFQTGWKLVEVD